MEREMEAEVAVLGVISGYGSGRIERQRVVLW
jgi:hypothetical protein